MTKEVETKSKTDFAAIERVLIQGDIKSLSEEQRVQYMLKVCDSLGLNPLTKPFEFITLGGRLVMYARKDATDQLRSLRKVSIKITSRERLDDIYVVTAQAKLPDGREDESTGAVPVNGLKGDTLANALMKAETKAKRRATLSICGLGILDESEVDSIPAEPKYMGPEKPGPNDGIVVEDDPNKIQCGKFAGRKWTEVDAKELAEHLVKVEERIEKAQKEGKAIDEKWTTHLQRGSAYLAALENGEIKVEEEEPVT